MALTSLLAGSTAHDQIDMSAPLNLALNPDFAAFIAEPNMPIPVTMDDLLLTEILDAIMGDDFMPELTGICVATIRDILLC